MQVPSVRRFILSLVGSLAVGVPLWVHAEGPAVLTGELPRVIAEATAEQLIPVSIVLKDQLTGSALTEPVAGVTDRQARRRLILGALQQHAARTQVRLRAELAQLAQRGVAERIRPLWIGNVIGADLRKADIERLARLTEVDHINWNPKRDVFIGDRQSTEAPGPDGPTAPYRRQGPGVDEIECGVQLMQAPRVWNELGYTGAGAVVAVIDTGVCWTHTDINQQMWVNPGEDIDHDGAVMDAGDVNGVDDDGNGFVDDLIGWDFDNADREPNDDNSHGSHCAGTVAGDGTAGTQAGMAPDAKIMAVKVGVTFADEVDVWNAMQYAANNNADAISMSLGWPHGQNPDRATWRTNCENTIDAGTAMVIAAGNEGSGAEPDNVRTPGDVPRVITVGAVDCSDGIAGFSSRGPVSWSGVAPFNDHPFPPGLIKPDISAPGVDTKSHDVCSGYSFKSGTSMATPHTAGAVALLFSANPGMLPDDVKALLEETSVDLGPPGKDNEYGSGRVNAFALVSGASTPDGKVKITQSVSSCSATLNLQVNDSDLKNAGTTTVRASSAVEPGGESVTLTETNPGSGTFRGTVTTAAGAAAADGLLQVQHGDTVTVTYIDANNGSGGTNVPKTASVPVDCVGPRIDNVRATDVQMLASTIRWATQEAGDSRVDYGPTIPPGANRSAPSSVTDHAIGLTGLTSCTTYYYSVTSKDAAGNPTTDTNGGNYFYFETLEDFGNGPQSCHAGRVKIESAQATCSNTVQISVGDRDLNRNPNVLDTTIVSVSSTSETTPERVTLTETDPNRSRFVGSINTTSGPPSADGLLSVKDGDIITVTYQDVSDSVGSPAISYDTQRVDCGPPTVSDLRIEEISDQRATIRFSTSERGTQTLNWGKTAALGNTITINDNQLDHASIINKFDTCDTLFFRLTVSDAFGNSRTVDNGGSPFTFRGNRIPGLYYRETFENGTNGWVLTGEWQVGAPQGRGVGDPTAAYNNNGVLGHDLTGLGTSPGNYEPNIGNENARSPILNALSWQRTKLMIRRQLNTHSDDDAGIWVFAPQGLPVFRSDGTTVADTNYSLESFDVASLVDGKPQVRLEFRQRSQGTDTAGGWNVDDVIFKDASQPDFGPCGSCGSAPSFAGAVSATDNNACGASGVTVSWARAVSWGTGDSGTYSVYRGTTPGFTPSASNRVALGLTVLSYNDATAPAGTLYYLVRAENNESCSSGPKNGGVVETNGVYVPVTETTTRPIPSAVTNLRLSLLNKAHVRLRWDAASNATAYRIYRSATPQAAGFAAISDVAEAQHDDLNQANLNSYFYLVKGLNPCGQEGP